MKSLCNQASADKEEIQELVKVCSYTEKTLHLTEYSFKKQILKSKLTSLLKMSLSKLLCNKKQKIFKTFRWFSKLQFYFYFSLLLCIKRQQQAYHIMHSVNLLGAISTLATWVAASSLFVSSACRSWIAKWWNVCLDNSNITENKIYLLH